MSRIYFSMACVTAGVLAVFGVKYLESRPRVEVACEDPKLGKFEGELHPSRVVETPIGWVITRKVGGADQVEVYAVCVRHWP